MTPPTAQTAKIRFFFHDGSSYCCPSSGSVGGAGSAKYESDGGPGIAEIMKRLVGSVVPDEDRTTFMRTQILFWLLCAIAGHAKNFRVFLLPESRFRLTPSYDVLSAYPVLGTFLSPACNTPKHKKSHLERWLFL